MHVIEAQDSFYSVNLVSGNLQERLGRHDTDTKVEHYT